MTQFLDHSLNSSHYTKNVTSKVMIPASPYTVTILLYDLAGGPGTQNSLEVLWAKAGALEKAIYPLVNEMGNFLCLIFKWQEWDTRPIDQTMERQSSTCVKVIVHHCLMQICMASYSCMLHGSIVVEWDLVFKSIFLKLIYIFFHKCISFPSHFCLHKHTLPLISV